MSATLEIYGQTAVVTDLKWVCADKAVEKVLNAWTKLGLSENNGIGGGADPNPDITAAEYIIRRVPSAKLIAFDEDDDDGLDENGDPIIY